LPHLEYQMKILIIVLSFSCYTWWPIKDIKFQEIWITNSSKVTIMRFINNKKDITNSKHCQGTMNKIENDKQWTNIFCILIIFLFLFFMTISRKENRNMPQSLEEQKKNIDPIWKKLTQRIPETKKMIQY